MIWVQGLSAFLIWVAFGVIQTRRSQQAQRFPLSPRRETRGLYAALLLVGAVAILFSGLCAVVAAGGFQPNGMAIWAWFSVIVIGLVFVQLQTFAISIAVSIAQDAVTATHPAASTSYRPRNEHHEKPS